MRYKVGCTLLAVVIAICTIANARATPLYTLNTLATFNGADGTKPSGNIFFDASGNLYGTTTGGGANSDGTVFEMAAGTHALSAVATFNGTNGRNPSQGVIADSSGNLYGTTDIGGSNIGGVVFEVAAGTHALSTLLLLNNGTPGWFASDGSGNLYNTIDNNGLNGYGTVLEFAAGTHAVTTLFSFNGTNGKYPDSLMADSSGNLYGTTDNGGPDNGGTVFKLAAGTHALTTLASFNGPNGELPDGVLIADASGNLYGITESGGAFRSYGTVFEIAAGTNALTTLVSFNGTDGQLPEAGLTIDASGNLFGTTYGAEGTVYEITAGTHTFETLFSFNGTDGANPACNLLIDASGNLFGTTFNGGANSDGTVFELSPVPEPSTFMLLGLGAVGLLAVVRRRPLNRIPR